MDYDMDMHIPQQIETLLHYRSQSDVTGFDYILDGINTMLNDKQVFLDGIKKDREKRTNDIKKIMDQAKKTILTALNEKKTEEGLDVAHSVLSNVEVLFNRVELEYMNNVLTTCKTYHEENNGGDNE